MQEHNKRMLAIAIEIAAKFHAGQFDKGGNPYILHPLKVMHYTRSNDVEIQCIAVLHDIVEDTEVTLEFLENLGFSARVVDAIDAISRREGEAKDSYQSRVLSNVDAMIVKRADLRHNSDIRRLKGITKKDTERLAGYNEFYTRIEERLAQINSSLINL